MPGQASQASKRTTGTSQPRCLAGCGIVVRPRQGGDEEGPAGKPEELDEGREDADHGRGGDNGSASAAKHLSEEDGERGE
jgi:hypothetical protein